MSNETSYYQVVKMKVSMTVRHFGGVSEIFPVDLRVTLSVESYINTIKGGGGRGVSVTSTSQVIQIIVLSHFNLLLSTVVSAEWSSMVSCSVRASSDSIHTYTCSEI